jgi:hypothetical protein
LAAFNLRLTMPTESGSVETTDDGPSYQTIKQGRQIGMACHGE